MDKEEKTTLRIVLGVIAVVVLLFSMWVGCSNPYTPEGHEGYVYSKPIAFGQGGYVDSIQGPSTLFPFFQTVTRIPS